MIKISNVNKNKIKMGHNLILVKDILFSAQIQVVRFIFCVEG